MARRLIKKDNTFSSKRVIGILSIFIMFTSVIGFIFGGTLNLGGSSEENKKYGEYTFIYQPRADTSPWKVKVDGEFYDTNYIPDELQLLNFDSTVTGLIKGVKMVHVTIDPPKINRSPVEEAPAVIRYYFRNALPRLGVFVAPVLASPPTNESIPGLESELIMSCDQATDTVPVIYVTHGILSGISVDNNCITIEGSTPQELYRLYDRLLLTLLGVME